MSRKFDQRLLNANARIMGQGVGLAALEAMFNLVETHAVLSSSMVRHHELAGLLSYETLALAVGEVLDPGAYAALRGRGAPDAVAVDIPRPKNSSPPPDGGGVLGGALPPELSEKLAKWQPGGGESTESRESTTLTSVTGGESDEHMHELLMAIVQMLEHHLTDMTRNARPTLMVT